MQPAEDDDDYGYQHVFEEALDRLACAVGSSCMNTIVHRDD